MLDEDLESQPLAPALRRPELPEQESHSTGTMRGSLDGRHLVSPSELVPGRDGPAGDDRLQTGEELPATG